mmetsp:Transcript_49607/g.91536  ORF Transcript_49607/g.91536 Transcript_49607/m.91536 type:complete len:211 (+) Transcript_49607:1165-1797(+)
MARFQVANSKSPLPNVWSRAWKWHQVSERSDHLLRFFCPPELPLRRVVGVPLHWAGDRCGAFHQTRRPYLNILLKLRLQPLLRPLAAVPWLCVDAAILQKQCFVQKRRSVAGSLLLHNRVPSEFWRCKVFHPFTPVFWVDAFERVAVGWCTYFPRWAPCPFWGRILPQLFTGFIPARILVKGNLVSHGTTQRERGMAPRPGSDCCKCQQS